MKHLDLKLSGLIILVFVMMGYMTHNDFISFYVPTTLDDFFLPGSQPMESGTFNSPNQCDNCHGGYDQNAEPAFTWRGSMMAHSMRDPLFEASMTIANQDAEFSGDLCIRCHSPGGWLEGRSTPTDGSELTLNDRQGVQCHACHRMMDPMSTDAEDVTYMNSINNIPPVNGNGMYVADSEDIRRGPYANVQSNHATKFSEFHKSSKMCATCHDVSNPVYSKQADGTYAPNALGTPAPSFDTYDLFPVERTYSEWKMSAYNSEMGVPSQAFGGNLDNVISCQDCHMKEVTGKGADKNFVPIRDDLGQHDLTGGNTFVPLLIKDLYASDTDVDLEAIDAGILRARYMLQNAATLNLNATAVENGFDVEVEIINETGHKLPSGYPEGRRMWINVVAYDSNDNILFESGAYDTATAVLNQEGTKIYEAKLGMSQDVADMANANGTGTYTAGESFHFALNNVVIKDNRIPPRGFTNTNFEAIQAAPVGYDYADGAYSDTTIYTVPTNTDKIEVKLYYQTASKEYIEFLRDKNVTDTKGLELYNLWVAHDKSMPELMAEAELYTGTLTIEQPDLSDAVSIYPNPASEHINISLNIESPNKVSIDLFAITGEKIRTITSDGPSVVGNHVMTLPVADLSSGYYIIRVNIGRTVMSKLLVID
jgi:hypothetical protein